MGKYTLTQMLEYSNVGEDCSYMVLQMWYHQGCNHGGWQQAALSLTDWDSWNKGDEFEFEICHVVRHSNVSGRRIQLGSIVGLVTVEGF